MTIIRIWMDALQIAYCSKYNKKHHSAVCPFYKMYDVPPDYYTQDWTSNIVNGMSNELVYGCWASEVCLVCQTEILCACVGQVGEIPHHIGLSHTHMWHTSKYANIIRQYNIISHVEVQVLTIAQTPMSMDPTSWHWCRCSYPNCHSLEILEGNT